MRLRPGGTIAFQSHSIPTFFSPGIDGFEVARRVREQQNYTPILMLTARGRPDDVLNGFEAGTDDYLPKPFDLDIFLARLNGLLRRTSWLMKEAAKLHADPDADRPRPAGRRAQRV